jgi:putative ABC transport system permease protein
MEFIKNKTFAGKMKKQDNVHPPRLAQRLFAWYCSASMIEDLEGDLEEMFYQDLKSKASWKAKLLYWKHALSLMFSYAIKSRKKKAAFHHLANSTFNASMLKSYFLIATRNLAKHRFFTIINVLGMAAGMSISLLLIAMLSFLFTYDNFHVNKDRIYRVISFADDHVSPRASASTPSPIATLLEDDFTGIDQVVRINSGFSAEAEYVRKKIPLGGYFVDDNFLEVFSFKLLKGNADKIFAGANSMVITASAAEKMFGHEDAIGKIIQMGEWGEFEITGVLEDIPKNSHMQFQVLAPYARFVSHIKESEENKNEWHDSRNSYVYMLLSEDDKPSRIESFLQAISKKMYANDKDFVATFKLQALPDIAPGPELNDQIGPEWGYASLSIFMILTLLILIPACLNYANISISRALKRMKEIGLRKVMGGQGNQIFFQFVTETIIVTLIALGISFYIFTIIKSEFLSMVIRSESLDLTPDWRTIVLFILFAILTGAAAGFVPALYFSKLNPVQALKSKSLSQGSSRFSFRKILTVGQFALSLGFIMSVVIVLNQYRQTLSYDFGFQQENILDVDLQDTNAGIAKNEFSKLAEVKSVSMSSHILGTSSSSQTWLHRSDKAADSLEVFQMFIDENFIPNLGLKIIAGENFEGDLKTDKKNIIVNEEFVKSLGIKDPSSILGQEFILSGKQVVVSGVAKNFHYMHLREPIKNFMFRHDPEQFRFANIRITGKHDVVATVSKIESTWKTFGGENKFSAQFFDDEIKDAYSFYFSMIKICGFMGFLAITISCLGMLGMVVFTVENRMKEVGVRKVMGASMPDITFLLSKDFIRLMVVAAMIAAPLTYLFFDKLYLSTQYYKIDIGLFEVVLSLGLMLVLGLATIFSQTIRAAKANPVDTLRSE